MLVGPAQAGEPARPTPVGVRTLEFRDLRIEIDARRVFLHDVEIQLTRSEFDLLLLLASNPACVLSREELFTSVWDTHWLGDGHAVEVQISRLRQKLNDTRRERPFIATVRSAGYRFDGELMSHIVTLEYDAQLRVTAIHPNDKLFFGWDPDEVIGRFFLLAAGPSGEVKQDEAVQMIRVMAATGLLSTDTVYEVRCADGTSRGQRARISLAVDADGVFSGARISIY